MSRRGLIATVLGASVGMGALLLAATGDPAPIVARPLDEGARATVPDLRDLATLSQAPTPTVTPTAPDGSWDLGPLVGVLLQILFAVLALAFVLALIYLVRAAYRRRPQLSVVHEPTFEVPPVPEEMLRTARDQLARLEQGEPRNAIVAAWLELEAAAAGSGLAREAAETSSEYTARVIGTWAVDRARLADLGALYREARFSTHPLGEDHRRRAIHDLEVLHHDLAQVARAQAEATRAAEDARDAEAGAP
ncbi:MAG: DUF4129 domain-containing protein [Terracoccus sp.]